jgi:phosphoribosylanthranilate isomerase
MGPHRDAKAKVQVKVKICGITNWPDARRAIDAGADFLGFNFYAPSPRYIAPAKARQIVRRLPKNIVSVGVFVNETEETMLQIAEAVGLHRLQLHGNESPALVKRLATKLPVIKALRVRKSLSASQLGRYRDASAVLLDGFDAGLWGGTGKKFDWRLASAQSAGARSGPRKQSRPRAREKATLFLAGGITPENVAAAIRTAKPYAVDVCSGVEARPGKKDPKRLKNFMREVNKVRKGAL